MKESLELTITHLYPDHMSIYGDMGNIIALKKRCEWRGINVNIRNVGIENRLPRDTDIYFMGGGQDVDQEVVHKVLLKKKEKIREHIEQGTCFLAICGAYQLLGTHFVTGPGDKIEGLGILDLYTKAPSSDVKVRCIGNVVCELNEDVFDIETMPMSTLVGFENHSGQTFLGDGLNPLGIVIKGWGNNTVDKTEGCVYKNLIGTYLHGSFLPKNPHITDWLIWKALIKKYKDSVQLVNIDNSQEIEAHKYIIKRFTNRYQ